MPIFPCEKCGCVENTACSGYWLRKRENSEYVEPALCTLCDPKFKKWHGIFERRSAAGYLLGNDDFLYSQETLDAGQLDHRFENQGFQIVGKIAEDGKTVIKMEVMKR
jgi:hypothetical protein